MLQNGTLLPCRAPMVTLHLLLCYCRIGTQQTHRDTHAHTNTHTLRHATAFRANGSDRATRLHHCPCASDRTFVTAVWHLRVLSPGSDRATRLHHCPCASDRTFVTAVWHLRVLSPWLWASYSDSVLDRGSPPDMPRRELRSDGFA